jgi:hypothetical protein
VGNLFASADWFSAHFVHPNWGKDRKYGDFLPFQDWQRTCNNSSHQDIVRDRPRRISLIQE